MTYQMRSLKFQFTLAEGNFSDQSGTTGNVLTIDNIKAEIEVGAYGGVTGTTLDAKVYGLSLENMALLSYKGVQLNGAKNSMLKICANDEALFFGSITSCYLDSNQMPDAPLIIQATATGYDQSVAASAFSARGSATVYDIISSIASNIGYKVVNADVNITVIHPYYRGNPIEQIQKCAQENGINLDIKMGIIFIWTQNGNIDNVIPLILEESGLIGRPIFYKYGLSFNCLYSNLILRGRKIQIETSYQMQAVFTLFKRLSITYPLGPRVAPGLHLGGRR